MSELKTLLEKYANHQLGFTTLVEQVAAMNTASREEQTAMMSELDDAAASGCLAPQEFESLKAALVHTAADEAPTVLSPPKDFDDDSDRTVVRADITRHKSDTAMDIGSGSTRLASTAASRPPARGDGGGEPPSSPGAKAGKEPAPGDLLKGRFVLEEVLGRGGMGVVFKARDLRKVEAHDRNPYVAVKVLNDSFKSHPQSLIALQREARKAQQLAHPNIVTVYDFDRDGDIVYMTMEYLEGEPLDRLLRRHLSKPMEPKQAIDIIKGICLGLEHAHKHDTIHSDLKPGNIFVTKDGTVKVFDFGIARAMKHRDGGGEQTVFDAGELGGLTPAYASYEMLDGQEPDVRDDIYALACIAYELLGGRHPFNKIPADEALARNLAPAPIKSVKSRQWKSLVKGLAFAREDRSPSVEAFLEPFVAAPVRKGYVVAAVIALVALAALLTSPITQQWREHQASEITATLKSGDAAKIAAVLKTLPTLNKTVHDAVLRDAKDNIISYFEKRAEAEVDTAHAKYNFAGAEAILAQAMHYYPDSAQVVNIVTRLKNRKNQLLNDYTNRFNEQLKQGRLLPSPNKNDVLDLLSRVAAIDPQQPLLHDPRLPIAYAQQARAALRNRNYDKADKLLVAGLSLTPGDAALVNLQDELQSARLEHASGTGTGSAALSIDASLTAATRRELITKLLKKPFASRDWSKIVLANLTRLEASDSADARWAMDQREPLAKLHLAQAQKMRHDQRYTEARTLANYAKQFKPDLAGVTQELKLIASEQKRFEQASAEKARQASIAGLKQTLLTQAQANDVGKAKSSLAQLAKLLPADDPFLAVKGREAIGDAYLRLARDLANRRQYDQAMQLVRAGLEVAPNMAGLKKFLEDLRRASAAASDPCNADFAGYGRRLRATCSDSLDDGDKGPVMVVVPSGGAFKTPFAIGKYEVSIEDYNIYCHRSKQCTPRNAADTSLPITGISIQEVQRYIAWLTKQTGFDYHLPSDREWDYAATADRKSTSKDYNCRVVIGDSVVKGNSILSVKSGPSNDWGLINFVGNAQEWVIKDGSKLYARGGSFQDSLSKCEVSLSRASNGHPDDITGFRVARTIGGNAPAKVIGSSDGK